MSDERLRRDELASAYLDGEATPAETAEVEADDALLARLGPLRAARDAVAAPVPPLSAEQRDQMISTALASAEAPAETYVPAESELDASNGRGARFVLLRRPEILVMAAAVVLLAAVVSASLITSRGGDHDAADVAAQGSAADTDESPAELAAPAAEESMADDAAEMEMAPAEEARAEADLETVEESAAESALDAAAEPMAEEVDITAADEEAEAEMAAPTPDADDAVAADVDPALPTVDLGSLESFESLVESIGTRRAASTDDTDDAAVPSDGATADLGPCAAAVRDHAAELGGKTLGAFTATVGAEDPAAVDALLLQNASGTLLIVYAAAPGCEVERRELADS